MTVHLESVEVINALCCDCCGFRAERTEPEFYEFTSIDHMGGYGSIFGDGVWVQVDLCQGCLQELAGPWLRLAPSVDSQDPLNERS